MTIYTVNSRHNYIDVETSDHDMHKQFVLINIKYYYGNHFRAEAYYKYLKKLLTYEGCRAKRLQTGILRLFIRLTDPGGRC